LSKEFAAEADKKSTGKEADKFLLKKCEQAESALQKLQKEYTKDEEQRKLLLLLAVNAELQKEWERAAVYYEQLLLYAPEFAEGYGKYGLFLLRRGQKNSSRRLYVLYRSSKADGTNCKSVEIWEKQMESETGEGK
jgi:Flp pilus assembly protein TadD